VVLSRFSSIFGAEIAFFVLLKRKIIACIQSLFFIQWVKGRLLNYRMLKLCIRDHCVPKGVDVINKIVFSARNLTSNAGLFLLHEHTRNNGIFDLIDHDLIFENQSTNRINMNHIIAMLCGNLIGIGKLERLKLPQSDPVINEFDISVCIFQSSLLIRLNRCCT